MHVQSYFRKLVLAALWVAHVNPDGENAPKLSIVISAWFLLHHPQFQLLIAASPSEVVPSLTCNWATGSGPTDDMGHPLSHPITYMARFGSVISVSGCHCWELLQ